MVGCLQVVWVFTVSWKKIKVYTRALYIVFLFVITEINFIKEIKHVLRAFIAWWKTFQSLYKFSSRLKPSTVSWVFTDLLSNSIKRSPQFSPGYEGTKNNHTCHDIVRIFEETSSIDTEKPAYKNTWIKNTRAKIWSKRYHIHKNTFSLKNENCFYIINCLSCELEIVTNIWGN